DISDSVAFDVANVAPTAQINGATQNVLEGQSVFFTSSAQDPGSVDNLNYLWTATKNGQAYSIQSFGSTAQLTADDNGDYTATLVVTDKDGASSDPVTSAISFHVGNVAPKISAFNGPSSVAAGSVGHYTFSGFDSGLLDTITPHIDAG